MAARQHIKAENDVGDITFIGIERERHQTPFGDQVKTKADEAQQNKRAKNEIGISQRRHPVEFKEDLDSKLDILNL